MYGVSFNTMIARTGTALQGEVSFRQDMPLQVDDIELLYATMGVNPFDPASVAMATFNQVGNYLARFGADVPGYILRDVSQIQATATHFFGPSLGADQVLALGEVGVTHVHDMPSKGELRLDGAGTYVSGNPILGPGTHPGKPIEDSEHFADATSWGYRLVCRLDFNNLIGAVNVKPRVAWRHDVSGNSPRPASNFLEGRKAISFGVGADYQNSWAFDISYTNYSGAGRYNLINDRDIISANIKYSF